MTLKTDHDLPHKKNTYFQKIYIDNKGKNLFETDYILNDLFLKEMSQFNVPGPLKLINIIYEYLCLICQ